MIDLGRLAQARQWADSLHRTSHAECAMAGIIRALLDDRDEREAHLALLGRRLEAMTIAERALDADLDVVEALITANHVLGETLGAMRERVAELETRV